MQKQYKMSTTLSRRLIVVCFLGVTTLCGCIFYSPVAGFRLLILEITHNDAPQSVGLFWTSDQSVAETSI